MTGFNHGITGAAIAIYVKNPYIAIPLSLVSHYIADTIPHFGFKLKNVFSHQFNNFHKFDFLFSIFLMLVLGLLFPDIKFRIWACMIAAAIPDIIWWFYRKSVKSWPLGLDKFTIIHYRINNRSHRDHFYFDIAWFAFMSGVIILQIK